MKVFYDCRYTRTDHHDGISRFTAGLVTALAKIHPVTMLISDRRQLTLLPDLPWELISAPTSWREPWLARKINRLRPDVVFSPMQTMGARGRRYRLILTLHDLIYYENRTPPRDLPAAIRGLWRLFHLAWWPQRVLLNRADAVVTVSNTTAGLIRTHRLTRRPLRVVPNAADEFPLSPHPRTRPHRATLLYMGSFMPYKNVDHLVRAMALLPEVELHLLSRISATHEQRLRALAPQARLVFHHGVTDTEYRQLLAGATALITASRAEGFGLPLLEAMRLGTPVLVSDIPIFREVADDAAGYFDPTDVASIASAIQDLVLPGEWERRSVRASEVAATYSWEKSASILLDLMHETVAER